MKIMPIDREKFQRNLNSDRPPSNKGDMVRLTPPTAAELPAMFQAEQFDTSAIDDIAVQNWETLDLGFDQLETQLVEQFRRRGKVTAAKARAAYSAELSAGLGKPTGDSAA
jgi:hypothetical protein